MEFQEQVNRQRVKYIISSYHLTGGESERCDRYLEDLFDRYSPALIELALTETIVEQWSKVPLTRGVAFFELAQQKLQHWETHPITTHLTPAQFQQVTHLDPQPIFESVWERSTSPKIQYPLG